MSDKSINEKVKLYLGREYNPENGEREVEFEQKKNDPTVISFWSDKLEKPKPTQEELDAL
jgi:hypothetical protein